MQIRKAQPEDKEKIEELVAQVFGDEFRDLTQKYFKCMFSSDYRKPTFLVAVEENDVIACGAYSEELFTIELWGLSFLAVREDKRNRGLGQKMIEARIEEISKRINTTVTVILNTMPGQKRLFEKCGFTFGGEDHTNGFFMMKTVEPERAKNDQ